MAQASPARFDAQAAHERPLTRSGTHDVAVPGGVHVAIHRDIAEVESEWRAFEAQADGTAFQTFAWLSAWQRHIGARNGIEPVIVIGRDAGGAILFLLPLAVHRRGFARELQWLGSDLCDYNAPLLARAGAPFACDDFLLMWQDILRHLRDQCAVDLVNLEKMPERVGSQPNPFMHLPRSEHPSRAYRTDLGGDWDAFYESKRSSATRRRDRTKRKRLADLGDVQMVDAADAAAATLDILMAQKAGAFAQMGVANLFARPGCADFYRAIAADPQNRGLVHVSRLDVGAVPAAVNLGLVWQGCYYHVLASYAEGETARFGAGAAHLHELMRMAIARGCRTFDFTVGDEPYKRDWCGAAESLYDHIAAASRRGALIAWALTARQRLKRRIKQTPVLWRLFSRVRTLTGFLRRGAERS